MAQKKKKTVRVGRRTVELSNLDKVLFPRARITKGQLVAYYHEAAAVMLPYLVDRPVSMQRYPEGIGEEGFYQKSIGEYFPDWIDRVKVKKEGGTVTHVVCQDAATLVYLANQACITPHVWLSKKDKLHHPDRLIFDLDPPGDDFAVVRATARVLRETLEELGLASFVMTTGGRGLHVVAPLDRSAAFDDVRAFARDLADLLARRDPKRLTTEARKNKRRGRLFLDTMRNAYAQTAVPPFAVRARDGAPVAMPLDWDELGRHRGSSFHLKNALRRIEKAGDPWKGMARRARGIAGPRKKLDRRLKEERPAEAKRR